MSKSDILLIDNFDSFSFNLVDEFASRGHQVVVHRNTIPVDRALELLDRMNNSRLVISPGPGKPSDAGCSVELIRRCDVPALGV